MDLDLKTLLSTADIFRAFGFVIMPSSESHTVAPVISFSKSKNAFFRGVLMVQLTGGH